MREEPLSGEDGVRVAQINSGSGGVGRGHRGPSRRLVLRLSVLTASAMALGAMARGGPAVAEPAEPIRLLAFGTSLTAGYGLAPEDGFTGRLEAALRADGHAVEVINAGVSGDTTAGGRARLDWALADRPDAVIVELGSNDGLRGIDPAVTRDNLDAILALLTARGLPVLFTGMYAPPNMGDAYASEFNDIFTELAAEYDVLFFPFFLKDVATVAALNQPDGIHPNADGVAVIVENILPDVRRLLAAVEAG